MKAKAPINAIMLIGLLALTACSALPPRPELADAWAPPPATEGVMAERLAPVQAQHPGESGFRMVGNGTEAYALRCTARRSPCAAWISRPTSGTAT